MIPVIEVFKSIQGEGKYTGVPSIFIRVSGCNLRCRFKNSICDTPYSSFDPEKSKYSIEDIRKFIDDNDYIDHVVITGGEPMMYRAELADFIEQLQIQYKTITIETNGTFEPLPYRVGWFVDLYSVSPKLSTSLCGYDAEDYDKFNKLRLRHLKDYVRIVVDDDNRYNKEWTEVQFKFVYSGQESLDEIRALQEQYSIPNNLIYLMPEGADRDQLDLMRQECASVCIEYGFNYSEREHIVIWGTQRRV